MGLSTIGPVIRNARKNLRLSQIELAKAAGISRATLAALENGHSGEIGFSKLTKLLSAVRLELKLQPIATSNRPTLEDLLNEEHDDHSLDRRR